MTLNEHIKRDEGIIFNYGVIAFNDFVSSAIKHDITDALLYAIYLRESNFDLIEVISRIMIVAKERRDNNDIDAGLYLCIMQKSVNADIALRKAVK